MFHCMAHYARLIKLIFEVVPQRSSQPILSFALNLFCSIITYVNLFHSVRIRGDSGEKNRQHNCLLMSHLE